MASFIAYVFNEDFYRLTNEVFVSGDGGSLYGQWTSTGNPVVHVAFSKSLPDHGGRAAEYLSNSFKLCHIGEWRPVQIGHERNFGRGNGDSRERETLLSKYSGRGTRARFLILDVNRAKIVPYLFDRRTPQGQGHLEILSGQNPFNLALKNTQPAANFMPSQVVVLPGAVPMRSPPQGADIKGYQWYSPEKGGNENVQFVFQKLQEIVDNGTNVEMSRDKTSHDMSMTLTNRRRKKWQVKFPCNFPRGGATLIDLSLSMPSHGGQYRTRHDLVAQSVPGHENLDKVVRDIISVINKH